jgi:hypothetical protein
MTGVQLLPKLALAFRLRLIEDSLRSGDLNDQ